MYLNVLDDKQKELFLSLVIYVAGADDTITESENFLLAHYCNEMMLPERKKYEPVDSLDVVLKELNDICSEREKNIIILEIGAVIWADNEFQNEEQEILEKIRNAFGVSKEKVDALFDVVLKLKDVYYEIDEALGE